MGEGMKAWFKSEWGVGTYLPIGEQIPKGQRSCRLADHVDSLLILHRQPRSVDTLDC
jgi:hypothetical protein